MPKATTHITKTHLEDLYLIQRKSIYAISLVFRCATRRVYQKLREYDIPQRSRLSIKGQCWSLERRLRFGQLYRGEIHHRWRGGKYSEHRKIRYSAPYKIWRDAVFERDDWTCVVCHKRGGDMEAHHIKPFALFPELRLEISNGETLCKKCHRTVTAEQQRQAKMSLTPLLRP